MSASEFNPMLDLLTSTNSGVATVLGHAFFRGMNADIFPHVLMRLEQIDVAPNETLFSPGQPARHLYFLESGYCQLWVDKNGIEHELGLVGTGACIGEEAFIEDAQYGVGVRARTDCRLIRLSTALLYELLASELPDVISNEEAKRRIETGTLWLDVASPDSSAAEWSNYYNLTLDELRIEPEKLLPDQPFVVSGGLPGDALLAASILCVRGISAAVLTETNASSLRHHFFRPGEAINIEPGHQASAQQFSLEIDVRSLSTDELDELGKFKEIFQANTDLKEQLAALRSELELAREYCERLDENMDGLFKNSLAAIQQQSDAVEKAAPVAGVLPETEASGPALVAAALLGGLIAWGLIALFS